MDPRLGLMQCRLAPGTPLLQRGPTTKREFYARWLRCEFGNRPRAYRSAEELAQDLTFDGRITIRRLAPGMPVIYNIPASALCEGRILLQYECILQEMMPDDFLVIQGSVSLGMLGMDLEYSTEPKLKFREAIDTSRAKFARGLTALQVLRTLLDPTGFDNVMDLLNNFPNAIVEFARYSIPVGVLARPTVIFEVREY